MRHFNPGDDMKILICLTALLAVVLAAPMAPSAQTRTSLQLATMAPPNSVWDRHLKEMITAWQRQKTATIRIFPSGALGDEKKVVMDMRRPRPSPHVAALTAVGLSEVDSAFDAFGTPFLFSNYAELNHVLDRMRPVLAKRLEDKGLVHLAWGHVGWARVFSTKPVRTMADLRQLRIWTSGDQQMQDWYRTNGFNNIVTSTMPEITVSLSTGKVEALPISPTVLNAFQWYNHAKFMLDLGIAPIIGAVVIARPTWETLSEADRKMFTDAARETEQKLTAAIPAQDQGAIDELVKRGMITVTKPEGGDWQAVGQSLAKSMQGSAGEIYPQIVRERDGFRQKKQP
jgi:TRAP-type C4-dicarboxylate transport system substrate-binding protein